MIAPASVFMPEREAHVMPARGDIGAPSRRIGLAAAVPVPAATRFAAVLPAARVTAVATVPAAAISATAVSATVSTAVIAPSAFGVGDGHAESVDRGIDRCQRQDGSEGGRPGKMGTEKRHGRSPAKK
jgi:hypothetical protein